MHHLKKESKLLINRMEHQKIINLLNNEATKFRTKNWVEVNDQLHGSYNTNSQI